MRRLSASDHFPSVLLSGPLPILRPTRREETCALVADDIFVYLDLLLLLRRRHRLISMIRSVDVEVVDIVESTKIINRFASSNFKIECDFTDSNRFRFLGFLLIHIPLSIMSYLSYVPASVSPRAAAAGGKRLPKKPPAVAPRFLTHESPA